MKLLNNPIVPVALFLILCSGACGDTVLENDLDAVDAPEGAYLGEDIPEAYPKIFGANILNGNLTDEHFTMSGDRRIIAYSFSNALHDFSSIIWTFRRGQTWSPPEIVNTGGTYSEMCPSFHPNENTLYYVSNKPLNSGSQNGHWNIYRATQQESGFLGLIERLDLFRDSLNGYDYHSPCVAASGNLYYTISLDGGPHDIYRSRFDSTGFKLGQPLAQLNSNFDEKNVFVAPDESYLIFNSNRDNALGNQDLYISYKEDNGQFGTPQRLGAAINTDNHDDYAPYVSSDGNYLFFSSTRTDLDWSASDEPRTRRQLIDMFSNLYNGLPNIFWVKMEHIHSDMIEAPSNEDEIADVDLEADTAATE